MPFRDAMLCDFGIIDAASPRSRACADVSAIGSAYVVVHRAISAGAAHQYYVFDRAQLLDELHRSSMSSVEGALKLLVRGAARTVHAAAVGGSAEWPTVVLHGSHVVGILGSPTASLPTGTSPMVEETRGTSNERRGTSPSGGAKRITRSGSRSAGEAAPEAAAPSATPAAVRRQLRGELPPVVKSGDTVSLLVSLAEAAPVSAGTQTISAPPGTEVRIVVRPSEGFALLGSGEGVLTVKEPQAEEVLAIALQALGPGNGRVRVFAFCNGVSLAKLEVTTSVVSGVERAQAPQAPRGVAIEMVQRRLPDLAMYIFEQGRDLTFMLESADGELHMKKYGPVTLRANPAEYFREFFAGIENLPLDTRQKRETAKARLEAKGLSLFNDVFPQDLRERLWGLRSRISTVQITSDEPWIPWEMCRLQGRAASGRIEEGPFFAEAFHVTRWLYGVAAAPSLRLRKWALVVPGDSGLPHASTERDYVRSLAGPTRSIEEVPASYVAMKKSMSDGAYDAWHFTGHARAGDGANADLAAIELADREILTPEDIGGAAENMLATRPVVFLNACQTAQAGLSLTGVGGWAKRFLQPSSSQFAASAFIGAYWSVDDEAAAAFTRALYDRVVLQRTAIGQAAKEARLAIRPEHDPTWLAYTVYADPGATMERDDGAGVEPRPPHAH